MRHKFPLVARSLRLQLFAFIVFPVETHPTGLVRPSRSGKNLCDRQRLRRTRSFQLSGLRSMVRTLCGSCYTSSIGGAATTQPPDAASHGSLFSATPAASNI